MPEFCRLDRDVWLFKPCEDDILMMKKMNLILKAGTEVRTEDFKEVVMRFCGDWEDFHEFIPLVTKVTGTKSPVYVKTIDLPREW